MELTQSFPPVDAMIEKLSGIDYKKQLNKYMDIVETIVVYVAAIATVLIEKIQTMKLTTPDKIAQFFYLNINFRATSGDEIIGLSVGNRYIGLYSDSINWGILDENGAL
jgi:hypothetical protein